MQTAEENIKDRQAGEMWLFVGEAAARRGITTQAISKAIKAGRVQARGSRRVMEVLWADVAAMRGGKGGLPPGMKPAGATIRTARTAEAARQNGRKGGRPKKAIEAVQTGA